MEFLRMMILMFFVAIISSCVFAIVSVFFENEFDIIKEKLRKERLIQKNEWKRFGTKTYKKNHFE